MKVKRLVLSGLAACAVGLISGCETFEGHEGAVIGSAAAGSGNRGTGAVIGGVVGGVAGGVAGDQFHDKKKDK